MGANATLKKAAWGFILGACAMALTWHGWWYLATGALETGPEPVAADIIVPLAGSPERAVYAAALLERGVGGTLGTTLVDAQCRRSRRPEEACATGVRNTVDEAVVLRRLFEDERIGRAIVVTSPYHVARAAAIFSVMFTGTGIDVRFVATPDANVSDELVAREMKSYLPSVGAAVLARVALPVYEWSMQLMLPGGRAASRHS